MIIIILALFNLVYAQDIEPASMSFTYKGQIINIDQDRFKQDKFLMGWQWSSGEKMINALESNVVAGGAFPEKASYESWETSNQILAQPGKDAVAWNRPFIQTAAWLTYEPGLVIPEDESFRTITDDPSNPIFGFKYVTEYGTLTFTQDADDFYKKHYRLALYQENFSSSTQSQELVLSNPWPNDVLYTKNEGGQHTLYTGKKWYLTINLRRTSSSFNGYSSTIMDDTPVLSIVLPYNYDYIGSQTVTGGPGTEQIKFYEVPETNLNNISNWYSDFIPDRPIGQYIPLVTATVTNPMSRTLTITREMIPNWLDNSGEPVDINIIASYLTSNTMIYNLVFNDESNTFQNPKYSDDEIKILEDGNDERTPFITSQGIEVYYHKTLDIAIDYIRIGNDISQDLLTGKFESGTYINTFLPYGVILLENDNRTYTPQFGFDNIQESIQGFLTTIASSSYTLPNNEQKYEFFRFYGEDTESENPIWWGMLRYWNLITDGLGVTRDQGYYHPLRYYHYTKAPNRYLGLQMHHNENSINVPYVRRMDEFIRENAKPADGGMKYHGYHIDKMLNSKTIQTPNDEYDIDYYGTLRNINDSLNSDYETGYFEDVKNFVAYKPIYEYAFDMKTIKIADGNSYTLTFNEPDSFYEALYTSSLGNSILKRNSSEHIHLRQSKDVLYSSKNWWMNYFISHNIKKVALTFSSNTFKENYPNPNSTEEIVSINTYDNKRLEMSVLRPKTSEEVRSLLGISIILGAKGILLDRESMSYTFDDEGVTKQTVIENKEWINAAISINGHPSATFSSTDDWGYVNQDIIGGDFTDPTSSTTVTGDIHEVYKYIDPEIVKRRYGVHDDRVYLGFKSTRGEIKKTFEWIQLNDEELMNLDLISWYTRSFLTLQNNHPYFGNQQNHSYGQRFFNLNEIRTKKIYQPELNLSHNYNPPLESKDSSFFEVSILKSKSTPIHLMYNSNTFYVGVQNKRTDPLFLNSKASTTFQEVQFYSGAEFDDKVLNGGYDLYDQYHSSTWWEARWWERFGARELIMPINLKPYGYGKFITFTDLGYDKYDDDPDNWFLTEPYNHVIDTILNHSNSLRVKLLPGQFKIIKAVQKTVLPDDEDCYTCDLVDDFDAFNLELKPVGTSPNCCWDVNLIIDYTKLPPDKIGCTFTDVPIKIEISSQTITNVDSNFPSSSFTFNPPQRTHYLSSTFSSSGTFNIGEICFNLSPFIQIANISLLFGKDTLGSFIGCNRRITDEILCDNNEEEEVESCCDKLGDVSSTFTSGLSELECCTTITIDTDTDSECIYNVALELSKNYWYDLTNNNNSITFSDLPLHNSNYLIGEYCTPYTSGHDCDEVSEIQRDLLFLGADGEIICRKPVTIYACCENIGGPSGGDVTQGPKVSFEENTEDEPFISLEKERINVKVIPNPNTGVFRIELTNKLEGQYEINIHDALGNKILGFSPAIYDVGIFVKYVNIQNYPNGAYFINIRGNKENITIPVVIR